MNPLEMCNETELLEIAFNQGLGRLRRGIPHHILVQVVDGYLQVTEDMKSVTNKTRARLAYFIHNPAEYPPTKDTESNWSRIMSQLPGCNGICTKFKCSEGKHALCFYPNRDIVP